MDYLEYPTLEQVEAADHTQLAKWYRFLPSPGANAAGKPDKMQIMTEQMSVMGRITDRFEEMGGMTPEISKAAEWEG